MKRLTACWKRKHGFRKILSCLAILALTATAIFFPTAVPAFAIPPPFPGVYWLHQETSSTIGATSWQLKSTDMDQVENTTTSVKPGQSQLEFQWRPGVSNYATAGTTTGYGWVFDSPLNGKYNAGQTWTFYVRIRQIGGDIVPGTIRAYVYRYNGTSTYTLLFTASRTNVTPSTTATTYSFTYTPASDLDMQGQYLYVHYTWQTGSEIGDPATAIAFHVEGTGLAAADRARIVPGSSSIPTLGYPLLVLLVLFLVYTLLRRGVLRMRRVAA